MKKRFFVLFAIVLLVMVAFALPAFAVSVENDIRWQDTLLETINDIEADVVGSINLSLSNVGISNNFTVSVTVQDSNGDTIASDHAITYWLTDVTASGVSYTNMIAGVGGVPSPSVPDGDLTVNPNTGYLIKELTTDVLQVIGTGADGLASIVINDTAGGQNWYMVAECNGTISTSLTISGSV